MTRSRIVVAALIATLAAHGVASAQSDDQKKDEATARYKRGVEFYKEENFRGALAEFRKAYDLTHAYQVLYNIGQVCYQLQDYVCATKSFESYVTEAGPALPKDRRDEVQGELAKLRPRIATVTIKTNVPDVDITIDDVPRGKTPLEPLLLSAGAHRLSASKAGMLSVTRVFDLAGAESPTIAIELADAARREESPIASAPVAAGSKWTTLSYVGVGAAGVLVVGAAVTGVLALSTSSDLGNARYVGAPSDDAKSMQSKVKTLRITSDILSGAAVATLGVTLALTLSRTPSGGSRVGFADGGANQLTLRLTAREAIVGGTF